MHIPIVYVLISSGKDIYIPQAMLSMWSCKYYNKTSPIYVVTDLNTQTKIKEYSDAESLIDRFITKEFEEWVPNIERSRVLKTTLRTLIEGDFLFVDTDTIFCGEINSEDFKDIETGIVEDLHADKICNHPFRNNIQYNIKSVYATELNLERIYFNSGCIYSKDCENSYKFFEEWHNNWLIYKEKTGRYFDQPALLQTVNKYPFLVQPLSGIYNVQIIGCIKYLYKGIILHFFNANWDNEDVHPFLNKEYYKPLLLSKKINDEIKNDILNCKSLFHVPTFVLGPKQVNLWISEFGKLIKEINQRPSLKKISSLTFKVLLKSLDMLNNIKNMGG